MIGSASKAQAREAIEVATTAFETLEAREPMPERAEIVFKAAELLRQRRVDYDALLMLEVGKTWPEADADTAEAIDFLEFYAREALRYAEPHPIVPIEGERNEMVYIPARRRRRYPAVELRRRDHDRHDRRGDRHRQHRACSNRRATRQ